MNKRSSPIIQVERLRDQVYKVLLDELRSGGFEPGQRLYELELAEKYGVSRTPIREALFQLAREGLLVEAERGYVFPKDTKQTTEDRLDVRLLLDPAIARHAATEASDDQIGSLSKALQKEIESVDNKNPRAFVEANAQFRMIIRDMCKNKLLVKCASQVDDQFQFARIAVFNDKENRKLTVTYHQKIFDAVSDREPERAEEAVRTFLLRLKEYFAENPPDNDRADD